MNLAEQVRQVHELKKPFELALKTLGEPYSEFDMYGDDFEGFFKGFITRSEHDEVYFINSESYYDGFCHLDNLGDIRWFYFKDKNHADAEKLAQQHGFTTEMVEIESFCGSASIKALKITWGE